MSEIGDQPIGGARVQKVHMVRMVVSSMNLGLL